MPGCADTVTVLAPGDPRDSVRRYAAMDAHAVRTPDDTTPDDTTPDDTTLAAADIVLLDDPDAGVADRVRERAESAGNACGILVLSDDPAVPGADLVLDPDADATDIRDAVDRLHRRRSYEAVVTDLFALCERRADLLEDGETEAETSLSELTERIRERRECTTDLVESFDETDYRAVFRDLD